MSDGKSRTGASLGMRERGAMRRRLEALRREGEERLTDLGALVFELAENDEINEAAVRGHAASLARLENEMEDLDAPLSGRPLPEPPRPKRPAAAKARPQ